MADFTSWRAIASPAVASALDDEFDDGALDVKWTEFDPNNILAVTEPEYGLGFSITSTAEIVGIYQSIPSGDFTIWTKGALIGFKGAGTNTVAFGLGLWEDATNVNGDLYVLRFGINTTQRHGAQVRYYNDYQNLNSVILGRINEIWYSTHLWLRIRRTGTTYDFDLSSDGVGWFRLYTGSLPFVPTHFGLIGENVIGTTARMAFQFFRYLDNDVGFDVVPGDRIDFVRTNGGGGDYSNWIPFAPPTAPSALDDEFDNSALDVKWTEFDPSATLTVTEEEHGLELTKVSAANWSGIYQSIPSGDFTAWASMSLIGTQGAGGNTPDMGLCLWEDATNVNGDLYTLRMGWSTTNLHGIYVTRWSDYQTFNASIIARGGEIWIATGLCFRIRRTGTTYAWDVSTDSIGWQRLHSGSITFTPLHIGLCVYQSGAPTIKVIGHWFRYVDNDVGFTGVVDGDRCDFVRAP